MSNLKQVRTLTANFSMYQGLKGIPFGLLLLIISFWANANTEPAPSLFFPVGISIVFFYLYWVVNEFYNRVYGVVIPENKQKIMARLREAVIGVGALIAFWVDVSISPSFSALGLIFASALLVDYVRVAPKTEERLLLFYPIAAMVMTVLSLLPVFGINWWASLGIKALIFAICASAGLIFAVLGVIVHISFEYLLLRIEDSSGEQQ